MRKTIEYRGTIEMEFIRRAFPDFSKIYAITDSDEFLAFDYSPKEKACLEPHFHSRFAQIAQAMNNRDLHTDYHLRFALASSLLHSKDRDLSWKKEIKKIDHQVNPLLFMGLFLRWIRSKIIRTFTILKIIGMVPLFCFCKILEFLTGTKITSSLVPQSNDNIQNQT